MIVGGYPTTASKEIEIVDVENQGRLCSVQAKFPTEVRYASGGAFSDFGLVHCGGAINPNGDGTNQCYHLGRNAKFEEKLTLKTGRYLASSVTTPNGTFIVIGGLDNSDNALATFEIIDTVKGERLAQQELDETISHHCSVVLNETTIFIMGGFQSGSRSRKTFFLDLKNLERRAGPEMKMARSYFGCATMNAKVIVAGGYSGSRTDKTEFLDLKSNDPSWKPGKSNIIEKVC